MLAFAVEYHLKVLQGPSTSDPSAKEGRRGVNARRAGTVTIYFTVW